MVKNGWIPDAPDLSERAEEVIRNLINRTGGKNVADAALYCKNNHTRANEKMDPYALKSWCWHVLAEANERQPKTNYQRGTVMLNSMKGLRNS